VKARTVHWAESTIARWTATGEAVTGGDSEAERSSMPTGVRGDADEAGDDVD